MAKIYTKGGDQGTTGLVGGERVEKTHLLIEAYGTVDELNSVCGMATAACESSEIRDSLKRIQNQLFVLGSQLACADSELRKQLPAIETDFIETLEAEIDEAEKELEPLRQFILPGGSELAARLHLARTVCRRAERGCQHASKAHDLPQLAAIYLNRLSDWFFVYARYANKKAGQPDIPWNKE